MTSLPAETASTAPVPRENTPWTVTTANDAGDWRTQASCRKVDSSVFFSPDGERGHHRARREAHAKRICHDCPVLEHCRDYVLSVAEPYGTWGGLSEADRTRRARHRRRETRTPDTSPSRIGYFGEIGPHLL
ncbi:WhiB family transcriptional regulator [Rhodococcus sp. NPDC056960]|uniref:WhiB family transcriptional regulator n=1 Tax=Rhodococcus sp. NPDC056960 TaxID=3345982 RepID=UPI00362D5BBE